MSEIVTTEKPAAKPRKKHRAKRQAAKAAAAPKKVPAEFEGMHPPSRDAHGCCNACNKDRCVISGMGHCSHPMKGGLPASLKGDHEAVKRFNRAKAALKDQMIDLRDRS